MKTQLPSNNLQTWIGEKLGVFLNDTGYQTTYLVAVWDSRSSFKRKISRNETGGEGKK